MSQGDDRKQTDAAGQPSIGIPILVLGSLRVLASGCTFDAIEELTNISQESHRVFFHQFCKSWGAAKATNMIKLPTNAEELVHITGLYELLGLPGCVGSIDCVHVVWDCCRASLLSSCRGKEKVPTLVFQVVVSPTKKILAVQGYYYGCLNDKTIARFDPAISALRAKGEFLAELEWSCISSNENGVMTKVTRKGMYFICDGGYHSWKSLIPPFKDQVEGTDLEAWSTQMETVRKDVECTFGILKKRFMFLKTPIRLRDPKQIENAFMTCCVLHNLLLEYDGRDDWQEWLPETDDEIDNTTDDEPDASEESGVRAAANSRYPGVDGIYTRGELRRAHPNAYNEIPMRDGADPIDGGGAATPSEVMAFKQRREDLIAHYVALATKCVLTVGM